MPQRTASTADLTAAGLLAAISADPGAPLRAGILGPGGYGKTALLDRIARTYRGAGVPVSAADGDGADGDGAVLVDDAHRLDGAALGRLRELARRPGARLVVTYRPGPRPAALTALLDELGAPVLLTALGPEEIGARARGTFDDAVPEAWVEWTRRVTGGVPRLVSRLLAAQAPGPPRTEVPARALDQFLPDFEQLGEPGRDCLTALATGAAAHPDLLAGVLDLDPGTAVAALAAIRAAGLVDADDALVPVVRPAALRLTPWERRLRVVRRLVEVQRARGGAVLGLVAPLLGAEVALLPEATLAAAFEQAAEEALRDAPQLAGRLLDAAVSAGTPAAALTARRARAAAVAGQLDEALRLADQVLVDEDAADRVLGVRVAVSVLAHRGLPARSAELCRWSAEHLRWPGDRAYAAVGLLGVGRLDEARELLGSAPDPGPPTSLSGAAAQLAEGVRESVSGTATAAMSALVRAASLAEPIGQEVPVPETPAAVAAQVGLHCGELDLARATLRRAVDAGAGGALLHTRHRLLAAWLPLVEGDTVTARTQLATATEGRAEPAARDRLLATAVEIGIANRDNDVAALTAARGPARQAVAEHPVDLFALLPLGEFVVAAARLRDQEWIAPYLAEARALLDRLGNPPLWSAPLIWRCLQAAVVQEEHDRAARHAAELAGLAHHNPLAAALAEAAGTWLRVLGGRVDRDEAERSARGLHAAGYAWDGARLAGQAAIRTTDRRAMTALLECARALQGKPPRPRTMRGGEEPLSEREKEVAELVIAGLTYKQVGKRLFISAKTVEHHVSRMKNRLGCASREELLTRLRELVG
ncbi:LuxR C-terminal-related transcriptional regulator [Saccharopolyspora cebuensis]|uniref:LuxR C-terminal-related transcriptional regulator n=1 Tax=Saccharopolyspora cebuensis TaxID=418759 RepID=A0ABV4CMF6_9PSEU